MSHDTISISNGLLATKSNACTAVLPSSLRERKILKLSFVSFQNRRVVALKAVDWMELEVTDNIFSSGTSNTCFKIHCYDENALGRSEVKEVSF